MLCDVFAVIHPLILVLQIAGHWLCYADIPVSLEKTINSSDKLIKASQQFHFCKGKYNIFVKSAEPKPYTFPLMQ